MTDTTAAQPLDPSDMDDIEALALAAPQVWYGTYQIADGITDENAVALIEACSPDTILALIAQARASQPAASIDQPIGHLSPAIGQPDAAICQPQGATGTTGAIELPALPKTCHVVRNGLGGIAFEAYAPEEMEAYARAAIAADRAKCQVSHTAEMAQWARDNNLNVPPHWEAQPASAQPDRGAAVAPSDAKGNADGLALPVFSVSRYSDTKQRGVLVIFDRRLSDDELRAFHDSLTAKGKADAAAAPAQKENQQ